MNSVTEFVVGHRYTNDQIRYSLNLENLGGIRPSITKDRQLRHLALMTTTETARKFRTENPYEDRIEGDFLIYTAAGREGDQLLVGRNKRLLEQYEIPHPFYGFANEGKQTYQFLGLLELVRHYQEQQIDRLGKMRTVWIFEFRIHQQPEIIPIDQASVIAATIITESRKVNLLTETERKVITQLQSENGNDSQYELSLEKLRAQLLMINPYRFEYLIKSVIEHFGFRNVEVTKSSGDGGIDLNAWVADNDYFFAGTLVQFQVKRWRHSIGSVEINSFRGAMSSIAKGVFVTTSHYTRAAIEEAKNSTKPSISLIDGKKLSDMVIEINLQLNDYQ